MSCIAIGFSRWTRGGEWIKAFVLGLALLACYLFPNPTGPNIQLKDQSKTLIKESLQFVRQKIPPGSILLTDNGGGLSLSYYLCHKRVVQYEHPFVPFLQSDCGGFRVITPGPNFEALPDRATLESISSPQAAPASEVWFFQAGWIIDKEHNPGMLRQRIGCQKPRNFGHNILVCQL